MRHLVVDGRASVPFSHQQNSDIEVHKEEGFNM
jgi:hypothetical protein